MTVRIERLEVFRVGVPLAGAFEHARAVEAVQKRAVVRVTATGGVAGHDFGLDVEFDNAELARYRFEPVSEGVAS